MTTSSMAAPVPPAAKRRRPRIAVTILRTLALVWLLGAGAIWLFQGRLVWHPGPPPRRTPADAGLAFEDVALRAADGVALHAWWIPAQEARLALVHCHGNAGNVSHRIGIARELRRRGVSTLLFDYRGFGRSEGEPDEEGTYLDAVAAFDWVHAAVGEALPVAAWGESLGGAVAIELARRRPLAALVTEAAFTSIPDVGARHYPWWPIGLLARIRYDNAAKVAELELPWLLLHGRNDGLVPFSHAQELFAAARSARAGSARAGPVALHATNGGHDGLVLDGEEGATTRAALDRFLDDVVRAAAPTGR